MNEKTREFDLEQEFLSTVQKALNKMGEESLQPGEMTLAQVKEKMGFNSIDTTRKKMKILEEQGVIKRRLVTIKGVRYCAFSLVTEKNV